MAMKKRNRALHAVLVAALIGAVPLGAEAVDRLVVKDGAGNTTFAVTPGGAVTASSFAGDGAALTNTLHSRGDWSAVAVYVKDDVVLYGGASYIAKQANTNSTPSATSTDWQVFAVKGADGATGATGPE